MNLSNPVSGKRNFAMGASKMRRSIKSPPYAAGSPMLSTQSRVHQSLMLMLRGRMMSVWRAGVKTSVQSLDLKEGEDHSSSASQNYHSNGALPSRLIGFSQISMSQQVKLAAYPRLSNRSWLRSAKSAFLM